jgi:signal peptidase I
MDVETIKLFIRNRGYIYIPSNGVSMAPFIRTGNRCRFEPLFELSGLQVGDILLYATKKGEWIGHRYIQTIVQDGEEFYICKGDSNLKPDSPISAQQIIGKMTSIHGPKSQRDLDGFCMQLWARLIVKLPLTSVCIHYGIRFITKMRRII